MSGRLEFVADDGGRTAAGFRGSAGDCVARAVAIASGKPYSEVYAALADGSGNERRSRGRTARNGIFVNRAWFKRYMESLGAKWTATMGIGTGTKVHLWGGELPMGRLVVSVSRHYTAVIDGVIRDTHDPQRESVTNFRKGGDGRFSEVPVYGGRCVYGYWTFPSAPPHHEPHPGRE